MVDILVDALKRKIAALRSLGDEVANEVLEIEANVDLPPEAKEVHTREARRKGEANLRGLLGEIDGLVQQNQEAIEAHRRSDRGTAEARSMALQVLKDDPDKGLGRLLQGAQRSGDRAVLQGLRAVLPVLGLDRPEVLASVDEALIGLGGDEASTKTLAVESLKEQAQTTGRFALSRLEGRPSAPERRMAMAHAENEGPNE